MPFDTADTIAAIASAPGGALRGIIRLSGPQTLDCLQRCLELEIVSPLGGLKAPVVQQASLPLSSGPSLPVQLYFWPTQRSYTRQITAELHTVGSPPLLEAALARLCACGARLAEPGEFTLRAFLAGRLDLTQAEAVLGVIDARSQGELDTALAQLAGGLAGPLSHLRSELLDLLAHLEAGLDFVEEDIQFITPAELAAQLAAAERQVANLAEKMSSRSESAGEPRVVFRGAPNVGKSSLLNALAGDDAAIVSDVPGTTRDYVVRRIHIAGLACLLIDTAGVEAAAPGTIASAAQAMTAEQSLSADLQLVCLDSTRELTTWERELFNAKSQVPRLVLWTKCDESRLQPCGEGLAGDSLPSPLPTSSRTGQGLEALRQAIHCELQTAAAGTGVVASTAARCRESLSHACQSLSCARQAASANLGEELVAAEVRVALEHLGRVAGAVYTDDLLDRIFSRFCIGK